MCDLKATYGGSVESTDRPRVTRAAGTAGEVVAAWRAAQAGIDTGELAYRRERARFERTAGRLRTRVFVSAVAAVATVVAVGSGGTAWWLCGTALSVWYGVTGFLRLRRARPPQRSAYPTAWSPAWSTGPVGGAGLGRSGRRFDVFGGLLARPGLSRSAVGADVAERLAVAEANLARVVPAVERLYPPAGAELARAVDEAAPLLRQQVERLVVLDGVARDMPGGPAAAAANEAAAQVSQRLRAGVEAYEGLLAAAAELLGAPDLGRSAGEVLSPAVQGMQAYTHGLGTADGTATG